MLEGEYINNNTKFYKSTKLIDNSLFIKNIVFIKSDILQQNIHALLKEENINTIRLTDDYKLDNLDFFNDYDLSFIKSIDILSDSISNINGLYNLSNLESINSNNLKIDYTNFPKLRSINGVLSAFSYKKMAMISNLESIIISNKFKEEDLSIFSKNVCLKHITLRGSKIKSLKGIENIKELKSLSLFHNRSIESLEGITKNHQKIKEIFIYGAPKLFHVNSYLSLLPKLESLQLEAKKIDSFKFLNNLNNLKLLSIHNIVNDSEDGDKLPLLDALRRTNSKIW